MEQIDIGARGDKPGDQRSLEHIGGAAGILAEDDAGLAPLRCPIMPADIASDLEGMLDIQAFIGPSTEAIRPEILHDLSLIWQPQEAQCRCHSNG